MFNRKGAKRAAAGVDLDLSGHTHDGQIFPGNLVVSRLWPNSCGAVTVDGMTNVTTSGVGCFGPFMRLGTRAEFNKTTS